MRFDWGLGLKGRNMNTLQAEWERLEREVMPVNAPEVQRKEMKRAFYMGAFSVLKLMDRMAEQDISEEAGSLMISGWHDEVQLFAAQIRSGQA